MTEIFDIIMTYAAIWAPSITAILGVVTTILIAVNKTKEQVDKLRADNEISQKKLNELMTIFLTSVEKNETLSKELKITADAYSGIKDYVDNRLKEKE